MFYLWTCLKRSRKRVREISIFVNMKRNVRNFTVLLKLNSVRNVFVGVSQFFGTVRASLFIANLTKSSNTLKQFVDKLFVFDHFVGLALKGSIYLKKVDVDGEKGAWISIITQRWLRIMIKQATRYFLFFRYINIWCFARFDNICAIQKTWKPHRGVF